MEGEQPDPWTTTTVTIFTNHLPTGMILQVAVVSTKLKNQSKLILSQSRGENKTYYKPTTQIYQPNTISGSGVLASTFWIANHIFHPEFFVVVPPKNPPKTESWNFPTTECPKPNRNVRPAWRTMTFRVSWSQGWWFFAISFDRKWNTNPPKGCLLTCKWLITMVGFCPLRIGLFPF